MIRKGICISILSLLVMAGLVPAASAAEAEPSVIAQVWFWEIQQNQSVTTPVGEVAVEAPSPFCPGRSDVGSPNETCAQGRLPVEVRQGDYETPDKVSAVAFDLSLVPIGSKVSSFTVTMLEAESGCYENENSPTKQQCEQTDAINAEDKEVQGCLVTEIFGEGEARPYKELPKFKCSDTDPVAVRKEIKNDEEADPSDADPDHVWIFDATALAQQWAKKPPVCACLMLRPKAPKGAEDGQGDEDDNWRVVFAGPKFQDGIVTSLKFTAPPGGGTLPPPPVVPTTPTDTGTTFTDSGTTGTSTIGGGLSETSTGGLTDDTTGTTAPGTTEDTAAQDPVAAGEGENAAAKIPEVENMPGYVWLAILAGLIAWSMVRSVVLDSAKGIRPNGVLAQIHQINQARGGRAAAAVTAGGGPLDALKSGMGAIGGALKPMTEKLGSVGGKLKGLRKG